MTRLTTSLAAASDDSRTIGEWASNNGVGGVVVILGAGAILYAILKLIDGKKS